jgi:hypothetical protein
MLMVVTLHIQYKDLFAGKDVLDINNKSSSRGDHIQRLVSELDDVESPDLSSILMSDIQPRVGDSTSTQTFLRGISHLLSTLMTGETHLDDSAQVVQTEESRTTTTSSADSMTMFEAESTEKARTHNQQRVLFQIRITRQSGI